MNLKSEKYMTAGNDVNEAMIAETLEMKVFLLTDYLINQDGKDISRFSQGRFPNYRLTQLEAIIYELKFKNLNA